MAAWWTLAEAQAEGKGKKRAEDISMDYRVSSSIHLLDVGIS
jgi:hypothetical protein